MSTPQGDFLEDKIKRFIEVCREKGLKVTHQRLVIYRAIAGSTDHPSADMVYQEVRRKHPTISLATVYKTLETLKKVSLVCEVGPFHENARYEANLAHHHHLICTRCKRITDLDETVLSAICLPDHLKEHQVLGHTVWVRGLCPDCDEKGTEKP
jgi:Fur family peroxide stress response transcriptional regulator